MKTRHTAAKHSYLLKLQQNSLRNLAFAFVCILGISFYAVAQVYGADSAALIPIVVLLLIALYIAFKPQTSLVRVELVGSVLRIFDDKGTATDSEANYEFDLENVEQFSYRNVGRVTYSLRIQISEAGSTSTFVLTNRQVLESDNPVFQLQAALLPFKK